jgi:hypothetical protein
MGTMANPKAITGATHYSILFIEGNESEKFPFLLMMFFNY